MSSVSECESVENVLWECSEYRSIYKEFISNLDRILQNDFHLKLSFDKTKYIFDKSIWDCNGHFEHWFSNAVQHMEFVQKNDPLGSSSDLACAAP